MSERQAKAQPCFMPLTTKGSEAGSMTCSHVCNSPEPMVRHVGLIYRKDKALSKAALGFIQVVLDNVGDETAGQRQLKAKPRTPQTVA